MGAYIQLLDWHTIVATLSGLFSVTAMFFYVGDILRGGETKPNVVSFFLWTVLQFIALVAQMKAGASLSAIFVALVTLNTATITVLALFPKYGYKKYGRIDAICFVIAAAAILLLRANVNPVLAIVLVLIGDLFASFPTVAKAYREPRSEHPAAWGIITVASIFGILSTDRIDAQNLIFPVYMLLVNSIIFSSAYFGRKGPVVLN